MGSLHVSQPNVSWRGEILRLADISWILLHVIVHKLAKYSLKVLILTWAEKETSNIL